MSISTKSADKQKRCGCHLDPLFVERTSSQINTINTFNSPLFTCFQVSEHY